MAERLKKTAQTKNPSKAELQEFLKIRKVDRSFALAHTFVVYGFLALVAFFVYKSIDSLAGRNTSSNIMFGLEVSDKVVHAVAAFFGVSGIAYGRHERKLRLAVIESMGQQTTEMSRLIDANASSSKLTTSGLTNPVDL